MVLNFRARPEEIVRGKKSIVITLKMRPNMIVSLSFNKTFMHALLFLAIIITTLIAIKIKSKAKITRGRSSRAIRPPEFITSLTG